MKPAERHRRIGELFDAVCDLPVGRAERQLEALCPHDDLRAEVLAMLRADHGPAGLIDHDVTGLLQADPDAPAPEQVGPYRILGVLGEGGMGVVYEAEQAHPNRRVALKVLHPWLRAANADLFRFEAQAMGSLLHPGIPQVYEAGEDGGLTWLVMERVRGEALPAWASAHDIGRDGRIEVILRICEAVQHAHDAGIVHRDLKPSNVLVTEAAQPKILDFGVATPVGEAPLAGTPLYMSPEQLRGAPADPSCDVYALGAIAWELLTGSPPHDVRGLTTAQAADHKASRPLAEHPEIRGDLRRILAQALAPDPSARTSSARELADRLRRYLDHLPQPERGLAPAYRAGLWLRRHRTPALAVAAVVALVGSIAGARWGVERWRQAEREQAASAQLVAANLEIDRLTAQGNLEEAEEVFEAFVAVPEHRGTAAIAEAWRRQARRSVDRGDGRAAVNALARAWVSAPDEATELATAHDLLDRFEHEGRWHPLLRLLERLPPEQRAALRQAEHTAAVAVRDPERIAAVASEGTHLELVEALTHGTQVPGAYTGAGVRDADGDGDLDLLLIGPDDALHLAEATPPYAVWGRIPHPDLQTWVHTDRVLAMGDALVLVATTRTDPQHTAVYEARWDRTVSPWAGRWQPVARLPPGSPLSAAVIAADSGPELYVALAYPRRGLARVGPAPDWEVSVPIPEVDALDSDITEVVAQDLDGDGTSELLLTSSAWHAYDARVYRRAAEGWELAGLQRLGHLRGVVALPAEPSPELVVLKSNLFPSVEAFGPERPWGDPPGLYWLSTPELHRVGFAAPPIAPRGETHEVTHARVGDFTGDGRPDLVAVIADDGRQHLWVIPDAEVPGPGFVIAGLVPYAAFDADGDGDDELLVGVDERELWILGSPGGALPPWTAPEQATAEVAAAPAGDASFQRAWGRAMDLLEAGLTEQAAVALVELGRLQTADETAGRSFEVAAALYEQIGAPQKAAALSRRASDRIPDDAAILEGLARTSATALDLTTAMEAWDRLETAGEARRPSWLEAAAASQETIDVISDIRPWSSPHPHAVRVTDDGWEVQVFNDAGVVLSRPLDNAPDRLGLELEVELARLELGASVAVRMRDPGGRLTLGLEIHAFGGGGMTEVILRCEGDAGQPLSMEQWVAGKSPGRLSVRVEHLNGELVCTWVRDDLERQWVRQPQQRATLPSTHTLTLEASDHPIYKPPMRSTLRVHGLLARGVHPRPLPPETAAHAMMRGAFADPRLDDAWADLALGDSTRTRASLAEIAARDDRTALRWMLRMHPHTASAGLHDLLGEGFFELFHEAWGEAMRHYLWRDDVRDALAVVELDALTGATPAQRALMLARSQRFLEDGEHARAAQLARRVIDQAADLEPRAEGRLILAQALIDSAPEQAATQVRAYLDESPTPSLARERVGRTGRLARLLP